MNGTTPYPTGPIAEIAVMQSSAPKSRDEFIERFGGLLSGFPEPVRFYWLHAGPALCQPFNALGHELVPVPLPKGQYQDTWIQDPLHVNGPSHASPELLVPVDAEEKDWEIARKLAFAASLTIRPVAFYLEGGNMLQIGETLLCGRDMLAQNKAVQGAGFDQKKLEQDLASACKVKQVVWLGDDRPLTLSGMQTCGRNESHQPFFHLDLFILPLGCNPFGTIQIAVAEIQPRFLVGANQRQKAEILKLSASLERVCDHLRRLGGTKLEIVRIPVLLGMENSILRLYSHCNGYVDARGMGRTALLPEYQAAGSATIWQDRFRALERSVQSALSEIGIHCQFIAGDFINQAKDCGSLHCRSKVIRYKI